MKQSKDSKVSSEPREVLREIGMIARCLDSISNVEFQHLNLSRGQYLYLYRICENPGIIPNQLAELLKVDRTTAARAISKLESDGFIVKQPALGNKKNKVLHPTETGLEAWEFIRKEGVHSDQVTLDGLSEGEVQTMIKLLRRMRHNIEVDWKFVKRADAAHTWIALIKRTLWIRPSSLYRKGQVTPSYIPVRRNGVKFIFRNPRSWYILLLVVSSVAILLLWRERFVMDKVSPTAAFVEVHMTNPNGTLATYLQDAASERADIVAGREALSESMGLWMQYALAIDNEPMFEQAFKQLQTYYVIRPDIYIAWKLDAQGKAHVATNALGDDLRILRALLQAADRWEQGRADKLATASALSRTLTQRTEQQGYMVDFYDFKSGHSTKTLSLVYVDLLALQAMRDHQMLEPEAYMRYEHVLHKMPDDGLFYPKSININTQAYTYDDKVNLIDQLIVANHVMETESKPDKLITFLKKEFDTRGKLPGQYDRKTRKPAVNYESASVYGLAILLAVRSEDSAWAKQLYKHMITFRGQDARYPGGYVFDGNTHLFDNLFPLLGEAELYNLLQK